MTKVDLPHGSVAVRALLTRFLIGNGVELGPGHGPFPLPFPGASAQYVDRWEPERNRELFPELGENANFPKPHIVADLNKDRLSALADGSQDFVIASHVLEHVADPLGLLAEMYRVLRPGGVALFLLPDRRHTFDSGRDATPLEHLVDEHRRGVDTVSDDHIEDFLSHTGGLEESAVGAGRQQFFDLHRQRSIHVHCWADDEFVAVLEHAVSEMGMAWELLDACFVEEVAGACEFGFVLRRVPADLAHAASSERLRLIAAALAERVKTSGQVRQAAELRAEYATARLEAIRRIPGFALLRHAWRGQQGLRRFLARNARHQPSPPGKGT